MSKKYNKFLDDKIINFVVKNGNSGKVNCPKKWIGKKVKVEIIELY
jgi:putative transposon-encoded protein